MKKVIGLFACAGLGVAATLATVPSEADTFYGTLVPMSTPVTLSATVSSLTIGTSTTLTAGGGDGTGGYRFNNNSNSFCSITSAGVVTASYPGNCSFTVTRLASGKYIDTTSNAVSLTALPEPDKSVISTPSPDPTPSATPRVVVTATPTPTASPSAAQVRPISESPAIKPSPKATFANISLVTAGLISANKDFGYKFSWNSDVNATSYSINVVGTNLKKSFSVNQSSVDVTSLTAGSYTMTIQAIDASGKLSKPANLSFTISPPKTVRLTATTSLTKPVINTELTKSLDGFIQSVTLGMPVSIKIEYTKSKRSQVNITKMKTLVEKYLKDKLVGTQVTVDLVNVSDSSDLATITGSGLKVAEKILIRKR